MFVVAILSPVVWQNPRINTMLTGCQHLILDTQKRKAEDIRKSVQEQTERAKVRKKKKFDEAKTTIEEKRLPLNDEGTQVSNISFTSTSEDLDITTEEIDID